MGMTDVKQNWESDVVDVPSTSKATKITELRGGESVTIKSLASTANFHYVGPRDRAESSLGFKLRGTDSMTFTLPESFGINNKIEIWAMATNAGDDVTYFKLIGPEMAEVETG